MARIYVAIGETKAGAITNLYTGNSRSAAKTAAATDVNAGTHYKGTLMTNLIQGRQVAAKNPAGT
jgi:hypothetical protein